MTEDVFNQEKRIQAEKVYQSVLMHAFEANPVPSKLAAQRAIYRIYGVAVDGYNPLEDKSKK